ncbi:hypothetical protein C5S32_05180 [ANME-1 cluster archaeon GoMg1]|nr:hypothetical protein [ANME-1 cluster archaeon GoMg1]
MLKRRRSLRPSIREKRITSVHRDAKKHLRRTLKNILDRHKNRDVVETKGKYNKAIQCQVCPS